MLNPPQITHVTAKKLASLYGDFITLTPMDQLDFIRDIRGKRRKPAVKVKLKKPKVVREKPPKAVKIPKEKKPRKPRVKKSDAESTAAADCSGNDISSSHNSQTAHISAQTQTTPGAVTQSTLRSA